MKNTKKALLALTCAVMLVVGSVMGTMAYLQDTTEVVKNTFTVGKVAITLDEAKVDEYGVAVEDANRVTANTYKLIPGHTYLKDPTVHVAEGSEDAWLFVKVENGLGTNETAIEGELKAKGWTLVDGETNVYKYENKVSAEQNIVVFEKFTLTGTIDVEANKDKAINITAYAVQADGFDTAAAAWEAAPANWN